MKYFFFLLFSISSTFAFVPPESFDSVYFELEENIHSETIRGKVKNAKSALNSKLVKNILSDYQDKIDDQFIIPEYFKSSVEFWFSIYTQYNSSQVVLHDMDDLSLIYHVLDFDELNSSSIHRFAKSKLQTELAKEYTKKLKRTLKSLATKNFKKLNKDEYQILKAVQNSDYKIPKGKTSRKKFFLKLARNTRTQTGQRNMVYQGVLRSLPYLPFLYSQIENFKLPKEIIAISFLESSFNPKAVSKVAASGVWQFMPYIGNLFMPKATDDYDYRQNPIISSLAAFHLLKQNKMILKRWDLAVPAYNSGTKHLVRAMRKFKHKKEFSLAYVLENYEHAHLGFASKNFYSEFLALVHTLAYRDIIYPIKGLRITDQFVNPLGINIYVSNCKIQPNRFFNALKKSEGHIQDLNSHFNNIKKYYPRGTLLVSDVPLTAKRYYKLSDKELRSVYPKRYYRYGRKAKCRK